MTASQREWLDTLQHGRLYYRPTWISWNQLRAEVLARHQMDVEQARGNAFRLRCPHCGSTAA